MAMVQEEIHGMFASLAAGRDQVLKEHPFATNKLPDFDFNVENSGTRVSEVMIHPFSGPGSGLKVPGTFPPSERTVASRSTTQASGHPQLSWSQATALARRPIAKATAFDST